MKKLILFALMVFTKSVSAQNTIILSGYFKENYRSVKLSQEVYRLLFIKTKGHLKLPPYDSGYFLNLTKEDSTKTGFGDIMVIPLYDGIIQNDDDKVTLELIPLSVNAPSVFFTKQNDVDKRISYTERIFTNPTLKDTVSWNEITNSDLYHTKQWIDNLDNEKEVTLKSYILYETEGGSVSVVQFSKVTMKKLAEERLHRVSIIFDEVDKKWTKKEWQNWFERTINYRESVLNDCNPNNYNISNIYKYDEDQTMLYGVDQRAGKILGIQYLSYNVDQYNGRQMVIIDSLKYRKYDYYREGQKQIYSIRGFESQNNKLFFVDFYGNWSFFERNLASDQYVFKEKKEIVLPKVSGKRTDYYISQLQTNENLMFAIIDNKKSKEFQVVTLKTQTGETLHIKPLKDLLAPTGVNFTKNIEIIYLTYGIKSSADFVFGIKDGDDYFLIKTNKELTDAKLIKTTKEIDGATLFANNKTIDVFKSDRSVLHKISFDTDLKTILSNRHSLIENWYYDEDGVVVYDGSNYKLFAPYRLSNLSGVNLLTLNNKLETVKKQCVYQFLPLEEPERNNMIHLQYATKLNHNWWLLFRHENNLKYVKVK